MSNHRYVTAFVFSLVLVLLLGLPGSATAQTLAQLEENKRIASQFFREGITLEERVALLHPNYIQHNPAAKKYADDRGLNYVQGFREMFPLLAGRGAGRGQAAGPQPPAGNPLHMVLAERDLVFIMRQQFRQDPTAAPGTWYEYFAWDVFRIKDGKLYEHWDGAEIAAPTPGRGRGGL